MCWQGYVIRALQQVVYEVYYLLSGDSPATGRPARLKT